MPRPLFVFLLPPVLFVACSQPPGAGGGQGTGAVAPISPTGAAATPAGTPPGAVPDDGTLAAVAPRTRILPPDGVQFPGRGAIGDFNGDGQKDLAYELESETYVWFGPLAEGNLEAIDAPVLIRGGETGAAGDIDGDGTDELGVGEWMVAIPGPGTYDDPSLIAVADFPGVNPVVGPFVDLDGDGKLDVVLPAKEALCVIYGPLTAPNLPTYCGVPAVPAANSAVIHGPTSACQFAFAGETWLVSDVSSDGLPELWLSDLSAHWTESDGGCGSETPDILFAGGDYRGQSLELTAAQQAGLDYTLAPVGDLDGDGRPELANYTQVYHASDLWAHGTSAAPFAWVLNAPAGSVPVIRTSFLDLSGDGHPELLLMGTDGVLSAIDGSAAAGDLGTLGGTTVDSALQGVAQLGDLDGDGTVDGISAWDAEVRVYSGAELTRRWGLAHP